MPYRVPYQDDSSVLQSNGGNPQVVNPKWLTFNWTHTDTNPPGSLKNFRIVVYKGTDPNLSSNYIVEPIVIPATETSAVVPVLVAAQVTVFGAIQAVYVNGNESSWRTISGTIVVDPDTVSLKDAAGVTAIQASVNDIASDDVLDTSEKAYFNLAYTTVKQEQSSVDAQATNFNGTGAVATAKTSYDNAVTDLTSYVNALSPAFTDFTLNTPLGTGGGATMRANFALVFSTREALLKAVADAQKALTDAAQGSGSLSRPIELWPNLAGQTVVSITDGMEGATALRMALGGFPNDGVYHPVDTSRKYKTRFWARAAAGTNGVLYFDLRQFLDSAGTPCATNGGRSPYFPSSVAAHTGWVLYEHTWQGSDFQPGVKFVQPEYLGNYSGNTGYWEIQGFRWFDVTEADAAQNTGNTALIPVVVGDGTTSKFLYVGPTVTKTDWQGTQQLYLTARTNLCFQSRTLSTSWLPVNASVSNATGLDGTSSNWEIIPSASTALHYLAINGVVMTAAPSTMSAIVKAGGYYKLNLRETSSGKSASFDLLAGTVLWTNATSAAITPLGNGYFLVSMSLTPAAGSAQIQLFVLPNSYTSGVPDTQPWLADGTSGIYCTDVQWEVGAAPTTRIITAATAVTVTDYTVTNGLAALNPAPAQGAVLRGLATNAQSGVNIINDPDTLTTGEKPRIILDYNTITGENTDLVAKANAYGVSHATYDAAYTALVATYLPTLTSPTAWNSLSGTTSLGTGNRITLWNPKWTAVKNAAADLRNAIAVGTAQNAITTAATDAKNKADAAQLASQPHQVAWAYASKPTLPDANYPAGYYAITTDSRTVQVNAAGTVWADVLVAAAGLFGQLFANQLTLTNFENLIPNPTSEMNLTNAPAGSIEAAGISSATSYTGSKCRALAGNAGTANLLVTPSTPVRVGESYYCECYAKQTQATTGSTGNTLVVRFYNSAGSQVSTAATPYGQSQGTSWTKIFGSFVVPNTAVTMTLELYSTSVPVGQTSYFDDLLLKRMADASFLIDGTLQALVARVPLLYSLDMRSGSDASGYTAGTASTAPIGFRISANQFTTTYIGGATDSTCQMELGGSANFGGYKVETVNNRSMTAFNRINNGSFYKRVAPWTWLNGVGNSGVSAITQTAGTGSAMISAAATTSASSTKSDELLQTFNCPPSNQTLTLYWSAATAGSNSYSDGGTASISLYLFNHKTGVETLIDSWSQTLTTQITTPTWSNRSVDVTSILSGGGEFSVRVVLTAYAATSTSGGNSVAVYLDSVSCSV